MKIEVFKDSILINGRYQMYQDGVIYDTKEAKDIPLWIFEFRQFVLQNFKDMEHQL